MIFSLFRSKPSKYESFATEMADALRELFPSSLEEDAKASSKKKLVIAVHQIEGKIDQFRKNNKLGVYRTAKIANTFKWALREAGYSEEFTNQLTKTVLVRLASKGAGTAPVK